MIQKQELHRQSDRRRILSFPAVHPCEGISPVTLLRSLISLGRQICRYQSNFFAVQRRNSREIIRLIGILLEFFTEVADDSQSVVPSSAVLCFSELHLTLQKVCFLLEDCSREGARVWILMKSQFVASQFRVLVRAISTALDVLPLDLIGVGSEVKELVDLVAKQVRKASFDLDQGDEWAMREIFSMLDYFEKGIEPNQGIIRWVLDYLEIKSWSDCHKEIKFLEEEIGYDCTECNEREFAFLSSLISFMSYCRGVIFESLDSRDYMDQAEVRQNAETLGFLNPEDFRCPISLELMTDPVTVSTGQTYDRSSIQKWLKAGNLTCPKTGEKLAHTNLVPNTNLRKLIQQFCADNGISLAKSVRYNRDITATIVPGSLAASGAIKSLSRFLARRLVFGSNEQKKRAAHEVRLLSKSNIFNRSCLVEAGVVPPLLNLLSSTDPVAQDNAISALLKLSKHLSGRKMIAECGGLGSIVCVLKSGITAESKQTAAATIFYLSLVKGYQKRIGEMPETIPSLVDLIREGKPCGKKNAVVALFGLLLSPGNHRRILDAGAVTVLVNTIQSCSSSTEKVELVVDSLAVLATLAESVDGTVAILRTPAVPLLTGLLKSIPSRAGKEYAVSILQSLCINGGKDIVMALARDATLISLLYSLLNEGTSRASNPGKKASSLIRILLNCNERNQYELHNSPTGSRGLISNDR